MRKALQGRPRRRRVPWTLAVGGLLAVAVVVFELRLLPSPVPSDQIQYFQVARDFPTSTDGYFLHQITRYGLLFPLRALIEIFGYGQVAYYSFSVLAGLSLALSVYAIGTLLFARGVGLAAAVLTVGNNVILGDLLQLLPDVFGTSLLCWALALAIAIRQRRPAVWGSRRRLVLALLGVGVLLAWSYAVREYLVFVWPLVGLILFRRVGWRGLLLVAAPIGAYVVLELVVSGLAYGDPLTRVKAILGHGNVPLREEARATYQNKPRRWYLDRVLVGLGAVPEGAWLQAALGTTFAAGIVAWRRLGIFLVWAALVYVPLVLLGGLVDPGAPKLRLFMMRYWFPLVPAIILASVACVWLGAKYVLSKVKLVPEQRVALVAALATLLVAAVPLGLAAPRWGVPVGYRVVGFNHISGFRDWLGEHRGDVRTLWGDDRTLRVLQIFVNDPFGRPVWTGRLAELDPDGPRPRTGDYVLVYGAQNDSPSPCTHCRLYIQQIYGKPVRVPADWKQVYGTPDRQVLVYRVG
ncbi:hypothetical protein [Flindersiella endophytica]